MRILSVMAVALLSACGEPLDLTGSWKGTYSANMNYGLEGGSLDLTIADGQVSGFGRNSVAGYSFTVAGEAGSGGDVDVVYTVPGSSTLRAKGDVELLGGRLVGTLEMRLADEEIGTSVLDLARTTGR